MLFLACNSLFSAAKSSWEFQTARSFLIVIVLSSMTGRSQSHSFLLFSSGEKWRFDSLRGEWNNLIECVLLFASCSFTSVPLKYLQITSIWTLVSATVLVNLLFTFKLCFYQFIQSLLAGIYFSFYFKHVLLYFFRWDEEKAVFILSELQWVWSVCWHCGVGVIPIFSLISWQSWKQSICAPYQMSIQYGEQLE